MSVKKIDFSQVLTDDQIYGHVMTNYNHLGKDWIFHQWNWMNGIYAAFKDHYKYLIVISLIERTLQFYDQINIKYTYDQFYSRSYLQIEKFSITELCEKLQLPKETVRRKVLELEKLGVLKRQNKQIIIDRSVFSQVKPERQLKITSRYIYLVSKILNKEKVFKKKLNIEFIENTLKKSFTVTWRWFYKMQIPMIICYQNIFDDVTTFHIWGTVAMNQAFNYDQKLKETIIQTLSKDFMSFNKDFINNVGSATGVSAMSISDMTGIPRATVIRKCKHLMMQDYLKLNDKKQYVMTGHNITKVVPYQKEIFKDKSKFLRKVLNLINIS
jgi:hypothetical protein